jgi:predicted DNA-binding transcriptional regulator YafY
MSAARTERLLNLLTLLLNTKTPISLRDIRELDEFTAYRTDDPRSGERAFERDKAALLELGVPLRWVSQKTDDDDESLGGYIIDRDRYFLPQVDLSPTDLALLSIAGSAALSLPSFPSRSALLRALAKLGFDVDEQETLRTLAHAPMLPGVDAEKLSAHLEFLHDAVARRVSVVLAYQGLRSEAIERQINPYGLYYRRGAWYLVGYCHLRQAQRTFHLARLHNVWAASDKTRFEIPASFNIDDHMKMRPWEFPQEKAIMVHIRLAERLVPAIAEIFGSRVEVVREDSGVQVRLQVTHRAALIAAVLPYGQSAEIIEPDDLRSQLKTTYQQLGEMYGVQS